VSEDTEDQKHMPWNEGMPTKPDVDSLLKAFPPETIKPGEWRASDAEIKPHIGKCDGRRYTTVTLAWRKRLERDHRVILFRQESVGYFCPTPDEVFAATHPTYEHVGRSIGKQMKHVAIVKPENDTQRMTQEHQGRLLYASKRSIKKDRMNVLPSTEAPKQPQIAPPAKALQK
jgi:hypothetical protein